MTVTLNSDSPEVTFYSESSALDWAKKHISFDKMKRAHNSPWSRTYVLEAEHGRHTLKVVPAAATCAPTLVPMLAERFPDSVQNVVAGHVDFGLLLSADPDGARLTYDLSDEQRMALLANYARVQAGTCANATVLAAVPEREPATQLDRLLAFLSSAPNDEATGSEFISSARDIIGRVDEARYFKPLKRRRKMLTHFISQAAVLPTTINHGDLRPPNASQTENSTYTLSNWDDACAGPAGYSLHGLFSGSSTIVKLLAGDDLGNSKKAGRQQRILNRYIDTLAENGYADKQTIRQHLGASACAGMIGYIIDFSRFRFSDDGYKADARDIIKKRLSDLLDICDFLSARDPRNARVHAEDYIKRGREPRAENILQQSLHNGSNDQKSHRLYAELLCDQGSHRRAKAYFNQALDINPEDADSLCGLGDLHAQQLNFARAISCYRRALHHNQSHQRANQQLVMALDLKRTKAEAERDDVLPRLVVSDQEFQNRELDKGKQALAVQFVLDYGTLVLENVFTDKLIEQCNSTFFEKYAAYFENTRHADALRIGDKRFQVTMDIAGPFNSEEFLANPLVMPLMNEWLDEKFVLGSVTAATSLPGSDEQWIHKDHPRIFSRRSENLITPPVGVSLMVPMVDLDEHVGTTKLKKKSHLVSLDKSRDLPSLSPYVNAGSCFFMDHRLSHMGEPNHSDSVRSIMNSLYHRRWFRDSLNFRDQPAIRVRSSELRKMPSHVKRLLRWTRDPGPRDRAG